MTPEQEAAFIRVKKQAETLRTSMTKQPADKVILICAGIQFSARDLMELCEYVVDHPALNDEDERIPTYE